MQTTLEIDGKKAKNLYPTASSEFKSMLEDTFGKKYFIEKITDRVKTFEDACEVAGFFYPASDDEYFTGCMPDEIAYRKLKVVAKALNEGWTPDWDNERQNKWYPWFYMNKPGFRLGAPAYGLTSSLDGAGSRLCFHSEELAKYAGTQFLDLYSQLLK